MDASTLRGYVCNEDDGTVSVIDLAAATVIQTISLGASVRPESIAVVPAAGIALITVPSAGPDGKVIELNLATSTQTTLSANPTRSGGSTDVVFFNSNLYFANQTGGSVSVAPLNGTTLGPITTIKVDLGARALAIDTKDNLLVVSNEGSGTLALVDLKSNQVVARINAVQSAMGDDDGDDDHSDRGGISANSPAIQALTPNSGKAGTTFTLTIAGTNLTGATDLVFVEVTGQGSGNGKKGNNDFTVTNVKVAADGKTLTATVVIAGSATRARGWCGVVAGKDTSSTTMASANTFTVTK